MSEGEPIDLAKYREPKGWKVRALAQLFHADIEYLDFWYAGLTCRMHLPVFGAEDVQTTLETYPQRRSMRWMQEGLAISLTDVASIRPYRGGFKVVSSTQMFLQNTLVVKPNGSYSLVAKFLPNE